MPFPLFIIGMLGIALLFVGCYLAYLEAVREGTERRYHEALVARYRASSSHYAGARHLIDRLERERKERSNRR